MVDCDVVYRGAGRERRQFAAVPAAGSYLRGPGGEPRLWRVADVLLDGAAVTVFAVEVSAELAAVLDAHWRTWGETDAAAAGDETTGSECVALRLAGAAAAGRPKTPGQGAAPSRAYTQPGRV
jgi:hypothetical protein